MYQNGNLSPEQLTILLKVASARLGKDPLELKKELQDGSFDHLLRDMGANKEKLRTMVEDKEGMEQLLDSPQVKTMLREILGRK